MDNQDSIQNNSQSQESMSFLKTVVDNGQTKNDSDKENDISQELNSTQEFRFDFLRESGKDQTMNKEDTEMWDDFYNEEEFEVLSSDKKQDEDDSYRSDVVGNRVLEKVEEEEEDDVDESYATDTIDNSSKECTTDNKSVNENQNTNTRKKRKKRLFKKVPAPSPPSRTLHLGGSHPNLGQKNRLDDSDISNRQGNDLETMSETSGREKKLNRRRQVARPRCAGPTPSGDRLEQKYQELEHLVLKPLASSAVYVRQTRNQMLKLQGLSPQSHSAGGNLASLPPAGQSVPRDQGNARGVIQIIEEDASRAYSIVCNVKDNHTTLPMRHSASATRLKRPQSAGQLRPATAGSVDQGSFSSIDHRSRGRARAGARGTRKLRRERSNSGGSNQRSDGSGSENRDVDGNNSPKGRARSRSDSKSPSQNIIVTDNHLKNSSNPALRQWLKIKDKEYKKQKFDERKKKRKERLEKLEEEIKKQEFLEKGEEKVKEWMSRKKKEAWRQAREERRRRKEEEKLFSEQQQNVADSLRGKPFIPIKRPESNYEKQMKGSDSQKENNEDSSPVQARSKFVYKRPVSGRVRLMKLQQDWKDDTKKQEAKKKQMDQFYAAEKERKMRVSYDQWLLKKREEDYVKRQSLAKGRALAKSDPELQNIVPEMARKRIENIQRGKKRVETGESAIDEKINRSFGGGGFDEGESKPSYRLSVVGDKKSLKQRPSSAKSSSSGVALNPKHSKSPRRPQSAHPRVEAIMDDSQNSNPEHVFKLPFPPAQGVPKYVAARQEKLFSQEVIRESLEGIGGGSESNHAGGLEKDDSLLENNKKEKLEMGSTGNEASDGESVVDETGGLDDEDPVEDESSFFLTHGNTEGRQHQQEETEKDAESVTSEKSAGEEHNEKSSDLETQNDDLTDRDITEKDLDLDLDQGFSYENEGSFRNEEDEADVDGMVVPPLKINDDTPELDDKRLDEDNMDFFEATVSKEEPVHSQLSESKELKSSIKHVSFSDENTIHEDPLIGIANDFFDNDDQQLESLDNDVEENVEPLTEQTNRNSDEHVDYELLDEIEGYDDDDDEAEDERGNYFAPDTPRDDDSF